MNTKGEQAIETLIKAYEAEELLLERASDEELKEWEPLLEEECDRLYTLLDPVLLDHDKEVAMEDRLDTVSDVLFEVREELKERGLKEPPPGHWSAARS